MTPPESRPAIRAQAASSEDQARRRDFSPACRLRTSADFAAMRRGKRFRSGALRIVWRKNELAHARLGMAVSRKVGGAVRRNAIKRRLREAFRNHPSRRLGVDILVIPDAGADIAEIRRDFSAALDRLPGMLAGRRGGDSR